jgi:hypothetical protein
MTDDRSEKARGKGRDGAARDDARGVVFLTAAPPAIIRAWRKEEAESSSVCRQSFVVRAQCASKDLSR